MEDRIAGLEKRMEYQEHLHRNKDANGNAYHTTLIDLRFFCGAVLISAAISFLLIKVMK